MHSGMSLDRLSAIGSERFGVDLAAEVQTFARKHQAGVVAVFNIPPSVRFCGAQGRTIVRAGSKLAVPDATRDHNSAMVQPGVEPCYGVLHVRRPDADGLIVYQLLE